MSKKMSYTATNLIVEKSSIAFAPPQKISSLLAVMTWHVRLTVRFTILIWAVQSLAIELFSHLHYCLCYMIRDSGSLMLIQNN